MKISFCGEKFLRSNPNDFFEAIEAIKTTAAFSFEQRCKDILFSQPFLQTSNRTF